MAYSRKKKRNSSELETRVQALKEDFDTLQQDVRELLNSLGHEATIRVSSAADAAGTVATQAAEQVEHYAEEGAETVRDAIRTQPFAAIALSMGAGALIGTLLRR